MNIISLSLAEEETWDDKFCLVEETDEGFKLSMQMPSLLYPHVIGKNGEKVSKIEKDTGTHIKFPKQEEEGEVGETFYQIYIILKSKPPQETAQNAKICWLLESKSLLYYRTLTG